MAEHTNNAEAVNAQVSIHRRITSIHDLIADPTAELLAHDHDCYK